MKDFHALKGVLSVKCDLGQFFLLSLKYEELSSDTTAHLDGFCSKVESGEGMQSQ